MMKIFADKQPKFDDNHLSISMCTRRYGDECCGGRVSLLHFCVVLVMAGVVVLTVGAVQFKQEIYLYYTALRN